MNQDLITINFPPDTELSKTNQTKSKTYKNRIKFQRNRIKLQKTNS